MKAPKKVIKFLKVAKKIVQIYQQHEEDSYDRHKDIFSKDLWYKIRNSVFLKEYEIYPGNHLDQINDLGKTLAPIIETLESIYPTQSDVQSEFLGLVGHAQQIVNARDPHDPDGVMAAEGRETITWDVKYSLVFSDEISGRISKLRMTPDYCDPDTSYREDVCAYVDALNNKAEEILAGT